MRRRLDRLAPERRAKYAKYDYFFDSDLAEYDRWNSVLETDFANPQLLGPYYQMITNKAELVKMESSALLL